MTEERKRTEEIPNTKPPLSGRTRDEVRKPLGRDEDEPKRDEKPRTRD